MKSSPFSSCFPMPTSRVTCSPSRLICPRILRDYGRTTFSGDRLRSVQLPFFWSTRAWCIKVLFALLVATATCHPQYDEGLATYLNNVSQQLGISQEELVVHLRQLFGLNSVAGLGRRSVFSGCYVCRGAMDAILNLYPFGTSDDVILDVIVKGCQVLKIEEPDVCDGAVRTIGPHILYVINHTDITPHVPELCSMLTGSVCDDLTGEEWLVELPDVPKPAVGPVAVPEEGKPTLKVLHIADIHLDPDYVIGSNAKCNKPHCCRDPLSNTSNPEDAAGIWGAYSNCDPPLYMVDNLMEHIVKTHKDIDYILWTGDAPPHDSWKTTREYNKDCIKRSNDYLRKYFPGIQVYPTIGNHEMHPINCFAPYDETLTGNEEFDISWLTDYVWEEWTQDWLPSELTKKDFYYSIKAFPGLKIIGLNSNYNSNQDWWTYLFNEDPAGQLAWLVKELQESEDQGEKVHILLHHPMGTDARKTYSHNFQRIVNRYENTIRGLFAGHTHYDEYQLHYDSEDPDRAVAVTYVASTPTPYTDVNPAYRIYTIDGNYEGSTYAVLDVENYYMDLEKANSPESNYTPEWKFLYSAKDAYKMESLQPQEWNKLLQKMINEPDTFNQYWQFWHRYAAPRGACEEECRKERLCFIATGDAVDYKHCNDIK